MTEPIPSMTATIKVYIRTLGELDKLAQWLSSQLSAGDLLTFDGPIGSGKTTFIQFLGQYLGITEKIVSPTYVLIHEYAAKAGKGLCLPMVHVDLYRLGEEGGNQMEDELVSILHERNSVVVVEWAEYGEFLTTLVSLALKIERMDDDSRLITLSSKQPLPALATFPPELTLVNP